MVKEKAQLFRPVAVFGFGCWKLDVGCWMFGFPRSPFEVRSLSPVSGPPQACVIFMHSPRVH
jgi:hypothetical protein